MNHFCRLPCYVGVALCLSVFLLACASRSSSSAERLAPINLAETSVEHVTAAPGQATATSQAGAPAGSRGPVEQALDDLAERLSIDPDGIELVELKAVEWPDTGLGCPQPGKLYVQVITPGLRVLLEAQGQVYEYHTDWDEVVVWCKKVSVSGTPAKNGDVTVQDGWPSQPRDDDVIVVPPLERKQKP
jgi:hypothetical protein